MDEAKRERIEAARARVKAAIEARRKTRGELQQPRYDEVYERGVVWLDSLAEGPGEHELDFLGNRQGLDRGEGNEGSKY